VNVIGTPPRGPSRARVWSKISGPLLAAGAAIAIEALSQGGFGIPNPPAILLLTVVFSAFLGGLGSGLVTALIAWVSFLYFFSTPGHPFHYNDENFRRVVVWGVTTPIMAIIVGILKSRVERVSEALRENAVLQANAALAEQAVGRRRAEQVLQESETRYRTLFESVPVGLVRTTPAGQILDANAAMVRILGFPDRETLIARNMRDIYFDPKEREWRAAQVAREGSVSSFESYQMRRYDGTAVWVETSGRATYDSERRVLYFDGVIMDVTDRKREEEARNRWAAIVESSDDAIIGKNLEGIVESWNPGGERLYGYTAAEVIGRPISLLAPPELPDEIPVILEHVKRGERIENRHTLHVHKDGRRIDVALTISPIRDATGRIIGASTIARNISAWKQAEEALRTSEERYRSLFNGVPLGLYRTLVGGEILEANPAFLRMLGCPNLETLRALGAWGLYVDPEARRRWIEALEKDGVVSGFESQLRRLDGSVIWVAASARIVHDPSGGASYLEGAIEDITERKEAQEAMLRAREADRANQAKSEFLSRMSHELRTPLNAILGFGQLLEIDSLSPKQHEYVDDILKGGRHLLELINEVLDIARIEAGRLTLSSEPVLMRDIVQESLALIAPLSAQENIRVEDGTAGVSEQFVLADRQRLKQVLLNLLSNAVKYNRRGGLVAVSCESVPTGRLRIKVSDTGSGIPADRLERLFTPFERLGAEDSTIEGTGLGLALSKRLIEVMGGALGVDSVVGQGSTFWVDLPVAESPAPQEPMGLPDAAGLQASPTAGSVLYMEDNLSNLKLLENLMALRPEVKLIAAMQGRLGLDLARQHHPDLILLDVHLPDMKGSEVLRRLLADPETRDIPVVVISADATRGQIDRLLAAGARAYLTKPLDVKKLLAVLDETLGRKGTSDAA
jgi:PAS domain S-box-containing protein